MSGIAPIEDSNYLDRGMAYALTTPVRNEIEILPDLVSMVERLSPRPALWLVVDDGSDDGSREFLERAAVEHSWLQVVDAPEQADEYLGGHIARIKRFGLSEVTSRSTASGHQVEFLGVLDADVSMQPDHYGKLIEAFERDPSLGVVSSILHVQEHGASVPEPFQQPDLPRGPTQFFRRECLDAMGGLPAWPGFDGAANVKAQSLGYKTRLLQDVVATHRRPTATRFGHGPGFRRKGSYAWFLGLHPVLVVVRAVSYSSRPPHSAGLHFAYGWARDALRRAPRCPESDVRRAYGWRRLVRAVRVGWASARGARSN